MKAPVREPRYTKEQTAQMLNVSVRTVECWIYRRKIGAFRGRPVQIPQSEIHRILAERYQPAVKANGRNGR